MRLSFIYPQRMRHIHAAERKPAASAHSAAGTAQRLSFTLAAVNDAVRGCGISALVEETEDPLKLTVSFPDTGGVPDDFARRQQVIEKLLPCHVLVEYQFQYMTWTLLEGRFLSWEQLEETGATWKTFEAQTL